MFTDVQTVRLLSGVTTGEVNDFEVKEIIEQADVLLRRELEHDYFLPPRVIDEDVGEGDGTTTQYILDNIPIVSGSCVVYVDGVTQTSPTDYSLETSTGVITFVSAPTSGAEVTADYDYSEDAEILKLASSYLTAYLCMVKKRGKLPVRISLSRLRIVDPETGINFWRQYRRFLLILKGNEAVSTAPTTRSWSTTLGRKEQRGNTGID